jgi:hypothetical protein
MTINGVLSISLAAVYICDNINGSTITKMRFTNPRAYNLSIKLFISSRNETVDLYDLILDAGDTVSDNMEYELKEGDKLMASSSIGKTFYAISIK